MCDFNSFITKFSAPLIKPYCFQMVQLISLLARQLLSYTSILEISLISPPFLGRSEQAGQRSEQSQRSDQGQGSDIGQLNSGLNVRETSYWSLPREAKEGDNILPDEKKEEEEKDGFNIIDTFTPNLKEGQDNIKVEDERKNF